MVPGKIGGKNNNYLFSTIFPYFSTLSFVSSVISCSMVANIDEYSSREISFVFWHLNDSLRAEKDENITFVGSYMNTEGKVTQGVIAK